MTFLPFAILSHDLSISQLNGMSNREIADLTQAMIASGIVADLSSITKPKVDKHSSGGVGDKVSLILAPMVCALGVVVPM